MAEMLAKSAVGAPEPVPGGKGQGWVAAGRAWPERHARPVLGCRSLV